MSDSTRTFPGSPKPQTFTLPIRQPQQSQPAQATSSSPMPPSGENDIYSSAFSLIAKLQTKLLSQHQSLAFLEERILALEAQKPLNLEHMLGYGKDGVIKFNNVRLDYETQDMMNMIAELQTCVEEMKQMAQGSQGRRR